MEALEDYMENIAELPEDIIRNFAQIREKDVQSQSLSEKAENAVASYVSHARKAIKNKHEPNPKLLVAARRYHDDCNRLAEEKIQLTTETYQLVDRHIRKLEQILKEYGEELQYVERLADPQQAIPEKRSHKRQKVSTPRKTRPPKYPLTGEVVPGASGVVGADGAVSQALVAMDRDMPIDPNEPLYCLCQRPSFGQMTACDNTECPTEWFHNVCVGLAGAPKGKCVEWLCPGCAELKKQGRLKV